MGGPLASWIASHFKKGDPSHLYPKYVKWCNKHSIKPDSKEKFIKVSKLYYTERNNDKAKTTAINLIGGPLIGDIYNAHKSKSRNERVLSQLNEDCEFLINTIEYDYIDEI